MTEIVVPYLLVGAVFAALMAALEWLLGNKPDAFVTVTLILGWPIYLIAAAVELVKEHLP
ncbi:hypothetical protein I6F35_33575 [Bradyrhizobium sp. BRP22]|uniref:hypothetical protein n=1 Tax=Bradyrhizobium sp. BRP22 TaxID=2793821 RepID=UPI001CD36281|nr:hypothetical protein [Bradyrhizobium sp. BRP22]MCA1458066.1 hypothetical protein [Bradyrhizobium sp. BRP22]